MNKEAFTQVMDKKAFAQAKDIQPFMDLRDWFAGQALAHLAGMLHPGAWSPAEVARRAYEIADNMMLFRSRE